MRFFRAIQPIFLMLLATCAAFAQGTRSLAQNAALRYWSAFSELQDATVPEPESKELKAVVEGNAPYDDSKYKELIQKNELALEIMARGTALPSCDWGLDYELGGDLPVEYARKALVLGRLNVLYASHLFASGDRDRGVATLAAGLRFSRDVAKGGSLFATLVAKDLMVDHLRATDRAVQTQKLSAAQRSRLQQAVAQLGDGLNWGVSAKRDLEAIRGSFAADPLAIKALNWIIPRYVAAINGEGEPQALARAPTTQQLRNAIPNVDRVIEEKQDLNKTISQTRELLQQ